MTNEKEMAHMDKHANANGEATASQVEDDSAPSHTPGPWKATGLRVFSANDAWAGIVASALTTTSNYGTAKANARLIAAAPDILAALKAAVAVLNAEGIVYGDSDEEPLDVLREAEAAIEKAEG
jgi:hypothetical protein